MYQHVKIAARAPVRIDPGGGGTDAPPYSVEYGGCVVNFSVARYAYAQFQRLEEGEGVHLYSLDLKQGVWAPSVAELHINRRLDFPKGFVRRLMKDHNDLLLVTQSDVPERTGLGGSGAMGVAIASVLLKSTGRQIEPTELALLCNEIERKDLDYAGGCQDSFGGAVGSAKKITCHRGRGGSVTCERLKLPPGVAERLERDMLLIHTGDIHLSGTIHEDIKCSYAMENSPTIAAMDRLKSAACRMADALEAGNVGAFVDAMNESRQHHYALHESCDSPTLRKYFLALDPHILGGKTCGAGGGGFIAVMTRPGHKLACAEAARALGAREVWPFKFDHEGAAAWEETPWLPAEVAEFKRLARA
jgi:D-glycero-alpha-D-manno-heptose-7-phosphate kinase